MEQKASIGRIVHYTNLGDPPTTQAAIITGLNDDGTVALHVFYKTGQSDLATCAYDADGARGTWRWPPRA